MNANSKHKDEAWKLIKFLTSDEGAVLHAEGGAGLPANTAKATLSAFVKANEKLGGLEEALSVTIDNSYLRTTTRYPKIITANSKINSAVMGPFMPGLCLLPIPRRRSTRPWTGRCGDQRRAISTQQC